MQASLGKADTALQSYTEQYTGTVTGVKVNGIEVSPTSGIVDIGDAVAYIKMNAGAIFPNMGILDLGTVITEHQSLEGYATEIYVNEQITSKITKTINSDF